jgi:hypothetical protein
MGEVQGKSIPCRPDMAVEVAFERTRAGLPAIGGCPPQRLQAVFERGVDRRIRGEGWVSIVVRAVNARSGSRATR